MGDERIIERIGAWEAAGLLDEATAARLRAAEEASPEPTVDAASAMAARDRSTAQSTFAQVVGPGVSIGEMFAYLGGLFLLGAYDAFVVRSSGPTGDADLTTAVAMGFAAAALAGIAIVLRRGDERRRRAAGVVLAVAVGHAAASGAAIGSLMDLEWPYVGLVSTIVASVAAIAFRAWHASLVTQAALLAALTSLAAAALSALEDVVVPPLDFSESGTPIPSGGPDPIVLVVAAAAWWLAVALGLGLLGLREARDAIARDDPAAGRRAALTRLWAGLVAAGGLATAVQRSGYDPASGEYGRVIEPWIADAALVVLAAVLVERAFRRTASTFVYAAALALLVALTDFNFTYLSDSTETGLLIEGVILLAAGFAADRLRRRLARAPGPADPLAAASHGSG